MGAASCTYIGELVLFGSLSFGYFLFIGCLVDTKAMNLNLLFKGFDRFVETLIAGLLYSVAVSIGTALLIVPGIIIGLGFSMTFFIMADDPNISGIDALKMSLEPHERTKDESLLPIPPLYRLDDSRNHHLRHRLPLAGTLHDRHNP